MKKGKIKNKNRTDGLMDFELMLRQFLGDKAQFSQDNRNYENYMRKWLRKIIDKITSRVDGLDTTVRHKKMLMYEVEILKQDLGTKNIDPWSIVIHLFSLNSRLLGYDYCKGYINTPVYFQDDGQYYTQKIFEGGDVMQNYYDKKNIISIRRNLYQELKKKGHSDFKIGQILNISEYQVKKLKTGS